MTLVKGHMSVVCQYFQRASPVKLQGQFHFKFHMQLSSKREKKVYILDLGHMTEMAAMPIYGKTLEKSSSVEPPGRLP